MRSTIPPAPRAAIEACRVFIPRVQELPAPCGKRQKASRKLATSGLASLRTGANKYNPKYAQIAWTEGNSLDKRSQTQQYCCVMISPLMDLGPTAPWLALPPGIHWSDLPEIKGRFAISPHRERLFDGFERVVAALKAAHCSTVYLDGSFVTAKPVPGDFDGCWEPAGVQANLLDPILLQFDQQRAAQKKKYFGEMFISDWPATQSGTLFLDFFQVDKASGKPKGIIGLKI